MKANNNSFIGFDSNFEESEIVLFSVPFDGTTSFRPGTRFAGSYMRNDSYALETYSPYLNKDLNDYKLFDLGEIEVYLGNSKKTLESIYSTTKKILDENKIPLMIGGEHLVTLGSIKAISEKYFDLHIIHFDAHTDLRDTFFGENLSHATVLRRVWDIVGDDKIFQFGIRSGSKKEFEWAEKHTFLQKFEIDKINEIVESIIDKPIYITIDLDVLDPSCFSGTGTPEPGGISYKELIKAIKIMSKLKNIVGVDIVELSPMLDASGASTAVACKTLRELTLAIK